ncbi:hypothetical protein AWB67_07618 [Caballeronia terrestris]|uniref:Uncharacterized protein n=1 Tax=Caballeronia terrestris TaxID=1226301 RepID=A0A158L5L1_9BURK|nr:hypothetical protein AWB67_07618 [Caballeronia terrestris]
MSRHVKSNSSRHTKSIASLAVSEPWGSTATFAPTIPTRIADFRRFKCSANWASLKNDGVLV